MGMPWFFLMRRAGRGVLWLMPDAICSIKKSIACGSFFHQIVTFPTHSRHEMVKYETHLLGTFLLKKD